MNNNNFANMAINLEIEQDVNFELLAPMHLNSRNFFPKSC
jgi:hypothetical protein